MIPYGNTMKPSQHYRMRSRMETGNAERTLHDLRMDALRNHPLIDLHMRLLRDTIDLLLQPTEPTHLLPLERAEQELPVHREDSREQFHEHSLNTPHELRVFLKLHPKPKEGTISVFAYSQKPEEIQEAIAQRSTTLKMERKGKEMLLRKGVD